MRLCTARNAENNKNAVIKYANRVPGAATVSAYGDETYPYGEICHIEVCLMPFKTEAEARAYGVSLLGGRKATLTFEEGEQFNEFTHVWVDAEPDADKQNSEFIVKNIAKTLNSALLILEIKDGANGR